MLVRMFVTFENLASSQESEVAQALHVRAGEASEILVAAKQLAQKRGEIKDAKKLAMDAQLGGTAAAQETYASRSKAS